MIVVFTALLAGSECPMVVTSSTFVNVYSSQSGGSILLNSSSCNLSLSYTLFQNSTSYQYGGAIYFYGSSFSCAYVCYCQCKAAFCFAFLVESGQNCNNMTCISKGNGTSSSGEYNLRLRGNYSKINNANISNCYSQTMVSVGHFYAAIDMLSLFCLFSNNSDTGGASFDLQGNASSYIASNWNVVGNTPGSGQSFLWFDLNVASFVFTSCSFSGNGNKTFAARNTARYSCLPTFIGCYFDIQSSSAAGMTTSNCQFGLSNVPTNTICVLSFDRCADIWHQHPTSAFTRIGGAGGRKLFFSSLFLIADAKIE